LLKETAALSRIRGMRISRILPLLLGSTFLLAQPGLRGEPVASICHTSEAIAREADGTRYISYGEEPEKIRFKGRAKGVAGKSIGYYWEFDGGTPARVPAEGFSRKPASGPVHFAGGGKAHFYVVDRHDPKRILAKDSLIVSHVTFENQAAADDDDQGGPTVIDGEPVVAYIPDNAIRDGHDRLEERIDFVVATDPPIPNVWLGELTSDKKSERIVPRHVITDELGEFHATAIARTTDSYDWGTWNIDDPAYHPRKDDLARMRRQNATALEKQRKRDATLSFAPQAEPVTYYMPDQINAGQTAINLAPAYRVPIPTIPGEKLESVDGIRNEALQLAYSNPQNPGHFRRVVEELPANVKQSLETVTQNEFTAYMWYSEHDHYILEDGHLYVRVPKATAKVYSPPDGTDLTCATPFARNGIIAALVSKDDGDKDWIQGIDPATKQVVWEFPLPGVNDDHLLWVNDRYLLGTVYGRRCSSFNLIDIVKHKVVKTGSFEPGEFRVENNKLQRLDDYGKRHTLFTFATPAR
jgi:hypothetical protein